MRNNKDCLTSQENLMTRENLLKIKIKKVKINTVTKILFDLLNFLIN